MERLRKDLCKSADKDKARLLQGFFKTGKGQYGEGDVFLGVVVPQQRKIVKKFWKEVSIMEVQELLDSKIHEERLIGLLILVEKYNKASDLEKKFIFDFYLKNSKRVNNWDLVDLTAPKIVGDFLLDKKEDRKILYKLVKSDNLWEKRISILATFAFIRVGEFNDSLKISELLLDDKHDLIHKAVGWMLREVGKRDIKILEGFLKRHYKQMPRTMLRYAIEKFDEEERKRWLRGEV